MYRCERDRRKGDKGVGRELRRGREIRREGGISREGRER